MIRLRILGALDLRGSDGRELRPVLAQPKRAALLTYLALASSGSYCRRDTLLALFWPEFDAEHARNSLSQSIRFLRRSLGESVLVSRNGDGIELQQGSVWCDAVAFEEALNDRRVLEALDLYRGELLDGVHVASAPDFERWLTAERARLASRYSAAVEDLAAERESAGDFRGAAVWWRKLAARDPYSSRLALRLMRALAGAGDPAAAVQHARVHETLLREELEVPPDAQLARFVRELQSVEVAERARPPAGMAQPATAGGGRGTDTPSERETSRPQDDVQRGGHLQRSRATLLAAVFVALLAVAGTVFAARNRPTDRGGQSIRSLAVLPLENLSGDSARQSFADGMHHALITELARYPELSVISRTSVMRYRATTKPLREIARELKVDGLVEGTLLWEGGRVRMNAQLVHGPSDRHIWARSYRRDLGHMLALQGELAEAIAREVRVASTPLPRNRRVTIGHRDSIPSELYLRELYLRGRHAELSGTRVGLQTAAAAYQRAIELDSTFSLAYAGLAAVYIFRADYAYAPVRPALDTASMLAQKAVALDSTLAEARSVRALTLGDVGDYVGAERELIRAIELDPSDARAHHRYSVLLVALGRGEEALRESKRAAELDPFAPHGAAAMQHFAHFLLTGERPWRKVPIAKRRYPILKFEPAQPWAVASDAVFFAEEGQCAEARSEIERAQELAPHNTRMLHLVAAVHWLCGDRARARSIVQRMERQPNAREQSFWIATAHSMLGDNDRAFFWLDQPERTEWRMGWQATMRAYRWLDPLRSDPRYARLLQRLGLPPVARTGT